jgi:glucose-6-phosphate isomerase
MCEPSKRLQGFVWNINSFDQWGVELGKVLASKVRVSMSNARTQGAPISGFNHSTQRLMERYLAGKTQLSYPEPKDFFPVTLLDVPGIEHTEADESHGLWVE